MNSDMRRVFAYLIKQRFIDRNVLSHFAHEKLIYEDKEFHNAVFVGTDENGVARHAHKRGTYTQGSSYRGNVEGSDPGYSFHYNGAGDTLYVFEAPIDMLSYITLYPDGWMQNSYVALDGVAEHAMLHQLSLNPHLKNVVLCMDHEEAGIEAAWRLTELLHTRGYRNVSVRQPEYKDWNEDLKAKHGVTPVPAQEHPKLEALPEICKELYETCKYIVPSHNPETVLLEDYKKLRLIISNGKVPQGMAADMTEHLQSIAAAALLAAQKQYRQMEQQVPIEQLIGELLDSYRPHQDRGMLRSRADDLQQDITAISRQINTAGICNMEDKHKLIASYLRLALDCVRSQIFISLEELKQNSKMLYRQNAERTVREQTSYSHIASQSLM